MKLTTVTVSALALFALCTGMLLMRYQAQQDTDQGTERTRRDIVTLLEEAQGVMPLSRAFLGQPCTDELVRQLGRMAALRPHLRGIRLLRRGMTVCASLTGAPDLGGEPPAGLSLHLLSGDALTPDGPVLVVVRAYPEGEVAVSVNGLFLRQALRPGATHPGLLLQAGGKTVDAQGQVRAVTADLAPAPAGPYPFSLMADPRYPVSGRSLLEQVLPWAGLSLLAAALVTGLCQRQLRRWLSEEARLRRALAAGDIRPWYQPVMDSRTGRVAGCEVLARWHTRRHRVLPPDRFIPLAERSGLTVPLTRQLLAQAGRELAPLQAVLPAGFHLSFNISAAHVHDTTLVASCRALQAVLPGVVLMAEVTEREQFEAPGMLTALRAAGVKLALDDFGTGYAGLTALDSLPVDCIKLDRSFTAQIEDAASSPDLPLMAELVTDIAQRMGLMVVAEGVETSYQRHWLTERGVCLQQGYLYARPLPVKAFVRFVVVVASAGNTTHTGQ